MTKTQNGFDVPELRRLRYFHGRLLGARDLQREQEYFREKLKLRMRCLLGYGVVCGLLVEGENGTHDAAGPEAVAGQETAAGQEAAAPPGPAADAAPTGGGGGDESDRHRAKVRLTPGLGVDACGNEVVVRNGCEIDLYEALPGDERAAGTTTGGRTLWLGVQYDETPVEPTRTVFTSECGDTSDCEPGWIREGFKVRVTATRPARDERCDTCCEPCDGHGGSGCGCEVLWLARIDGVEWDRPVRASDIDLSIRRPFGRRVPTVITGINWIHGHTYTVREAKDLLGTTDASGGLVVRFSDDVRTETLRRGVVDIQVIEGGAGKNADSWFMGGEFADLPQETFTRQFRYRQNTRETLQDDDRVLITVRTAFLLDGCCRPVDGTHVGGRVPLIDGHRDSGSGHPGSGSEHQDGGSGHPDGCALPPSGVGPWTSGSGAGGDVFESWFFVREG